MGTKTKGRRARREQQAEFWPAPPKVKPPARFILTQWEAIESTYIAAKSASEAYPGVSLRDVCRIRVQTGYGDRRQVIAQAFGTRANFKAVEAELLKGAPQGAQLCVGFDQRPYATKHPLYPKYAEWLAGKRPIDSQVIQVIKDSANIDDAIGAMQTLNGDHNHAL